ncbi:MAG: caspase family protein, partial [Rhizomicrobium sp.]
MKLRQLMIYGVCLAVGAMFTNAAAAERRVALVVGNSDYKNASSLSNTINDSIAIGALFKSIGFDVVISRTDLGVVDFKRTVREFL